MKECPRIETMSELCSRVVLVGIVTEWRCGHYTPYFHPARVKGWWRRAGRATADRCLKIYMYTLIKPIELFPADQCLLTNNIGRTCRNFALDGRPFPLSVWRTTLYIYNALPFWVGIFIIFKKNTTMFTVLCTHGHSDWQSTDSFLYVIGKSNIM